MTIEQAEKLICPFIQDASVLSSHSEYCSGHGNTECITDKCMAWETGRTIKGEFKSIRGLSKEDKEALIKEGYNAVEFKGLYTKLYRETELHREQHVGYCRRLK